MENEQANTHNSAAEQMQQELPKPSLGQRFKHQAKKWGIITGVIIALVFSGWLYFRYWFVFGEGIKAGTLNKVERMGYIFKTYEGTIILTGLKSNQQGALQSNEFRFSVEDEAIADSLMHCSGRQVQLRYEEYKHTLPWRGYEKAVVTEIVEVR